MTNLIRTNKEENVLIKRNKVKGEKKSDVVWRWINVKSHMNGTTCLKIN